MHRTSAVLTPRGQHDHRPSCITHHAPFLPRAASVAAKGAISTIRPSQVRFPQRLTRPSLECFRAASRLLPGQCRRQARSPGHAGSLGRSICRPPLPKSAEPLASVNFGVAASAVASFLPQSSLRHRDGEIQYQPRVHLDTATLRVVAFRRNVPSWPRRCSR